MKIADVSHLLAREFVYQAGSQSLDNCAAVRERRLPTLRWRDDAAEKQLTRPAMRIRQLVVQRYKQRGRILGRGINAVAQLRTRRIPVNVAEQIVGNRSDEASETSSSGRITL